TGSRRAHGAASRGADRRDRRGLPHRRLSLQVVDSKERRGSAIPSVAHASSITLIVGQIALMTLRSPLIRAVIALLFAVPAAVAGYYAALGLAHIGPPPRVGDRQWQ